MKNITTLLVLLLGVQLFSQTTEWNLDKAHSSIEFSIAHMVVSETTGEFKEYSLITKSDKVDFTDATFDLTIQVNSVDTGVEKRNNHIKNGKPFFDAKNYPTITFKSKELKRVAGTKYKLIGDFTMKGITKTIALDANVLGPIQAPMFGTTMGLKITGTLDRTAYGFGDFWKMKGGEQLVLSKEVDFVIRLELHKKKKKKGKKKK